MRSENRVKNCCCYAGHLGGLFTGLALGYVMAPNWDVVGRLTLCFMPGCQVRLPIIRMVLLECCILHHVVNYDLVLFDPACGLLGGSGERGGLERGNHDDSRGSGGG